MRFLHNIAIIGQEYHHRLLLWFSNHRLRLLLLVVVIIVIRIIASHLLGENHFRKRTELKLLQNFVTFLLLLIDQIILTVHVADFGFLQALILSQSLLLKWVLVRDELAHIDLAVITRVCLTPEVAPYGDVLYILGNVLLSMGGVLVVVVITTICVHPLIWSPLLRTILAVNWVKQLKKRVSLADLVLQPSICDYREHWKLLTHYKLSSIELKKIIVNIVFCQKRRAFAHLFLFQLGLVQVHKLLEFVVCLSVISSRNDHSAFKLSQKRHHVDPCSNIWTL